MFTLYKRNNLKVLQVLLKIYEYTTDMSSEYAMHGQFSVKFDIFSFGVLILEIISGQRNSCFRNGASIEDLQRYVSITFFFFL